MLFNFYRIVTDNKTNNAAKIVFSLKNNLAGVVIFNHVLKFFLHLTMQHLRNRSQLEETKNYGRVINSRTSELFAIQAKYAFMRFSRYRKVSEYIKMKSSQKIVLN